MNLFNIEDTEPDLQTGSPKLILPLREVVQRYVSPGEVLAEVRRMRGLELAAVAFGAGLKSTVLERYEAGLETPTLAEIPALAAALKIEIRVMLELFGHLRADAAKESLGIAAMFSGELTEEEKADLRKAVEIVVQRKLG